MSAVEGAKLLCHLAKPSLEVVWGGEQRRIRLGGIAVDLINATNVLESYSYPESNTNGPTAWSGDVGLHPGRYSVVIAGVDPNSYEQATAHVDLQAAYTGVVTVLLVKLARPRVKVVSATGEAVAGVAVKLVPASPKAARVERSLGETRLSGIAELAETDAGIAPGLYEVIITDERFRSRLQTPVTVELVQGSTETFPAVVDPAKGALIVELNRYDGLPVSRIGAAETIGLTTKKAGQSTAIDRVAFPKVYKVEKKPKEKADVFKAVCEVKDLDVGDYEIALKDLRNLLLAQQSAPAMVDPLWVIGPKSDGTVTATVEAGKTTTVSFTMSRYKMIQFIAFNMEPGFKDGYVCRVCGAFSETPGDCHDLPRETQKVYRGRDSDDEDLGVRCYVMKEVIKKALKADGVEGDDDVLKLFMAPEFFFRGKDGGYSLDLTSSILDQMRQETKEEDYKDWLFVYGTAIGYNRIEGESFPLRIERIEGDHPTRISVSAGASILAQIHGRIPHDNAQLSPEALRWQLKQGEKILYMRPVMSGRIEVRITKAGVLGTMRFKWKTAGDFSKAVRSVTGNSFVFPVPGTFCTLHFAAGSYSEDSTYAILPTGAVTPDDAAGIPKLTATLRERSADTEEFEIDGATNGWTTGGCQLVGPRVTEIFNIALVQKGGPDGGVSSLRELLIYKDLVSAVDFAGPDSDKTKWEREPDKREIYIHKEKRALLPTAGSKDVARDPGDGPELNISGLGGGSVFTVDGITFGLEVCLDHSHSRLWGFYQQGPKKGTPKVQVQLIPACGSTIDEGVCCGVQGALIFNVDGPQGSTAATLKRPPNEDYEGEWKLFSGQPGETLLPVLSKDVWTIQVLDNSKPRKLVPKERVRAASYEELFARAVDIKVYGAKKLPPAEIV